MIDEELFRRYDAEGLSTKRIAELLGCTKRSAQRARQRLGLAKPQHGIVYSSEVRAQALAMLEDGASYSEVSTTLGMLEKTVRHWFPGMGWSNAQAVEYRHMREQFQHLA